MKRIVLWVTLFFCFVAPLVASGYYTGSGGRDKIVLLDEPTLVNGLKDGSDKWLLQSVARDVMTDLQQYSAMTVQDAEQIKNVIKLQKASESTIYDDSDVLELGRLAKARSYIKLTVTRVEKNGQNLYGVQSSVVSIASGKSEGGYNPKTYYSQTDFLLKAHGELSAGLLESLGVALTETGKRLIRRAGAMSASSSGAEVKAQSIAVVSAKELKDAEDNLSAIGTELSRMQEQLAKLETSKVFDREKEAERMRLESQQAALRQQQQSEQEKIERMKADAERRAKEAEASKRRSAEQQQKINEMAKEIAAKERELAEKAARNSVEELVVMVEKQKAVYADNQVRIDSSVQAATTAIEAERRARLKEKFSEPVRKADLNADGSLTEDGQRALDSAIAAINKKYDDMAKESVQEVEKNLSGTQTALFKRIMADIEQISATKWVASTVDGRVILRVGDFDGSNQGWNYELSLTFNGSTVWKQNGVLSYRDITGTNAPSFPYADDKDYAHKKAAYEAYQDEIDRFDSLFRMNVPFMMASVTYTIAPAPYRRASEWDISVLDVSFLNTLDAKAIAQAKIAEVGSKVKEKSGSLARFLSGQNAQAKWTARILVLLAFVIGGVLVSDGEVLNFIIGALGGGGAMALIIFLTGHFIFTPIGKRMLSESTPAEPVAEAKIIDTAVYRYKPVTRVDFRTDKEKESDDAQFLQQLKTQRVWAGLKKLIGNVFWVISIIGLIIVVGVLVVRAVREESYVIGGIAFVVVVVGLKFIVPGVKRIRESLKNNSARIEAALKEEEIAKELEWRTFVLFGGREKITFTTLHTAEVSDAPGTALSVQYSASRSLFGDLRIVLAEEQLVLKQELPGVLLLEGSNADFPAVYVEETNSASAENNVFVEGRTFSGKWNEKYDSTITFSKNGKANIVFSDGDKASGTYLVTRDGKTVLYNHRNRGVWKVFALTSSNGEEWLSLIEKDKTYRWY